MNTLAHMTEESKEQKAYRKLDALVEGVCVYDLCADFPSLVDVSHHLDREAFNEVDKIVHVDFRDFLRHKFADDHLQFSESAWADIIDMMTPSDDGFEARLVRFKRLWREFRCPLESIARGLDPRYWETDCWYHECEGCDKCQCDDCTDTYGELFQRHSCYCDAAKEDE